VTHCRHSFTHRLPATDSLPGTPPTTGFPEGYYWVLHEDVAFLRLRRHAASLLGAQTINDITKLTSKYMRYPGNALDRQLEQFQKYVRTWTRAWPGGVYYTHHVDGVFGSVRCRRRSRTRR
jgi:hypothetical protein